MLSKKNKTELLCKDAIITYKAYLNQMPEMLNALSKFLYAPEIDSVDKLYNRMSVILNRAYERAERALDDISKDNELRRRGSDG